MKFPLILITVIFLTNCNSMTEQNTSFIGSIGIQELEERIQSEENIRLIDIRDPIELEMLGVLE